MRTQINAGQPETTAHLAGSAIIANPAGDPQRPFESSSPIVAVTAAGALRDGAFLGAIDAVRELAEIAPVSSSAPAPLRDIGDLFPDDFVVRFDRGRDLADAFARHPDEPIAVTCHSNVTAL